MEGSWHVYQTPRKINKVAKEKKKKKLVWMVAPYGLHYLHMGELEGVSFQPQSLNILHIWIVFFLADKFNRFWKKYCGFLYA